MKISGNMIGEILFTPKMLAVLTATLVYLNFLDWWTTTYTIKYVGLSFFSNSEGIPYEVNPLGNYLIMQPNAPALLLTVKAVVVVAVIALLARHYKRNSNPKPWALALLFLTAVSAFVVFGNMVIVIRSLSEWFSIFGSPPDDGLLYASLWYGTFLEIAGIIIVWRFRRTLSYWLHG